MVGNPSIVAVLKTTADEAQESVVAITEELLEKAKRGDIREICAAVIFSDGEVGSYANQTVQRTKRIGAVTQLLYDLLKNGEG